jgi:ergothioneine biosynthesis protein EgtB
MSRPTVQEVKAYRQYIDHRLNNLLTNADALTQEHYDLITLGLNHEQQHQELMITDLKYNLSFNPLYPIYAKAKFPREQAPDSHQNSIIEPLQFIELGGGIYNMGHKGVGFCFDNETPRHQHLIQDFRIAQRLITNEEYCLFIDSGGYQDPQYWLADGWAWVQQNNITGPLYWQLESEGQNEHTPQRFEFRLTGYGQLHPKQPVTHVSFYEADAYARWAGKRLPSEFEWEVASKKQNIQGTFVESKSFHPLQLASYKKSNIQYTKTDIQQLFGDCWQWTQSSYTPYPGFKIPLGAVGEYNGKFMCNQMVLRGGSCATPKDHFRTTYRNFFYPQDRWQFTGIRLAEDG